MLRFGTFTDGGRTRRDRGLRWRLWMVFAAACLLMFLIQLLRQPQVADRIDRLYSPKGRSSSQIPATAGPAEVVEGDAVIGSPTVSSLPGATSSRLPTSTQNVSRFDLSSVRDNTYFRTEESAAWFDIWDWLKDKSSDNLASESLYEVTYAQLIEQPDIYRGQVVSVRGTVYREELLDSPANNIGIESYHRLIIRPKGGGVWPIIVYCLELPNDFPRGDEMHADMRVDGIFFKNWSYSWEDGLGLAPVILARTIQWYPQISTSKLHKEVSSSGVVMVVVSAAAIATLVGWLAARHARRSHAELESRDIVISPPHEAEGSSV